MQTQTTVLHLSSCVLYFLVRCFWCETSAVVIYAARPTTGNIMNTQGDRDLISKQPKQPKAAGEEDSGSIWIILYVSSDLTYCSDKMNSKDKIKNIKIKTYLFTAVIWPNNIRQAFKAYLFVTPLNMISFLHHTLFCVCFLNCPFLWRQKNMHLSVNAECSTFESKKIITTHSRRAVASCYSAFQNCGLILTPFLVSHFILLSLFWVFLKYREVTKTANKVKHMQKRTCIVKLIFLCNKGFVLFFFLI